MGFSGGGSNVLLPHTHDGRVSQDGGALNFSNITQSQSAAGQVFYSDGVALQQLSIGAPSDELRVNAGATAPEWYTPAAASATWTELVNETVSGGSANLTGSWLGSYNILSGYIYCQPDAALPSGITYNSDNSALYCGVSTIHPAGYTGEKSNDIGTNTTNFNFTHFWIYNYPTQSKLSRITTTCHTGVGSAPTLWDSWQTYDGVASAINSIECVNRNTGVAMNFKTNSQIVVLGAN